MVDHDMVGEYLPRLTLADQLISLQRRMKHALVPPTYELVDVLVLIRVDEECQQHIIEGLGIHCCISAGEYRPAT